MKKQLRIIIALLVVSVFAFQTEVKAQENMHTINGGIGVGSYGLNGTGGIPISISYEYTLPQNFKVGGFAGYVSSRLDNPGNGFGNYYHKYTYFIIGARGSYNFNELLNVTNEKIDLYAGAGLFYRSFSVKYYGDNAGFYNTAASGGGMDVALHLGGAYMFTPQFGAFAELGYGISPLQLGARFKF